MIGEGGVDVMTKPADFKITPEALGQKNFTPLPEFQEPTITEPQKHQEPTGSPQIDRLMADILAQEKDNGPQAAVKKVEKNIPQEKKPQGFWAQLIERIKIFFKDLFR